MGGFSDHKVTFVSSWKIECVWYVTRREMLHVRFLESCSKLRMNLIDGFISDGTLEKMNALIKEIQSQDGQDDPQDLNKMIEQAQV